VSDDLYALLRVQPEADAREIKKAYFGLVRQYSPETHPEEFQKIRAAYDTLSNPEARKAYDQSRSKAAEAGLREELAAIMRGAIEAMEAREFDRAVPLLTGVVNERPDAEEARGRLCACLLNLERYPDALDQARAFEQHHSALSLAVLFRAYALRGLDRDMEARAAFVRAGELDPLDFRPVRGVVDVDFKRNEVDDALTYLEQRLTNAPESIRVPLQFERISTLFALRKSALANQALDQLEATATTPELQEELQWFYEREAAGLFARRDARAADELLERLRKRQPNRPSIWTSKERVVPVSALAEPARKWLEAQPQGAQFLYVPRGSTTGRGFFFLVFGALMAFSLVLGFSSTTEWPLIEYVLVGLVFGGFGAAATATFVSWWTSWDRKLPNMLVLHPMAFLEVMDDTVRILPLVRMSGSRATHHHGQVGYTHTSFGMAFGGHNIDFSINGQERAENMAKLLSQLRMRMLDLMHNGLLGGEEGVDFFPTEDTKPAKTSRTTWRAAGAGAIAGVLLTLLAGFSASRTGRSTTLAEAIGTSDPNALRGFIERHAGETEAIDVARKQLLLRRDEAAHRLEFASPELSKALLATPDGAPLALQLAFERSLDQQTLQKTPYTFVDQTVNTGSLTDREDVLIHTLQTRVDSLVGYGWVSVSRNKSATVMKISYEVSLGTARYFFRGSKPRDTAWAEPLVVAKLEFAGKQSELRSAPSPRVRLDGSATEAIARGNSLHGSRSLVDAAWKPVMEEAAGLVGLRD
jgi:tetratricopeptide (TPR) repeat protein